MKVKGEFVWHTHDDTDELFIVVAGELSIQLRDGDESSWFCSGTHRAASSSTSGRSRTPTPPARQYPLHGLHGTFPGAPVIGTPVPEHPAHPVKHRPSHRGCQRMRFLH